MKLKSTDSIVTIAAKLFVLGLIGAVVYGGLMIAMIVLIIKLIIG